MDYFSKLEDLLKMEREEDRQSYLKLTATSSISERRSNGLTWYPIAIRGSEMSRGDYLTVELERTTHLDMNHQFRFGVSAVLFSGHDPKENRIEGIISYQNGNRLKLTLHTDELPDWADDGKLGLDLLFDDNSYDEMHNALKQASALYDKSEEGQLIKILIGEKSPGFQPIGHSTNGTHSSDPGHHTPPTKGASKLNPSQLAAVDKILSANELAILHGPPPTP